MIKLKYVGEKNIYDILFKKLNSNIVQITGDFPVKAKGFICFREEDEADEWNYEGFTTVYREIDGGAQFSDNGSVYIEPVIPEPGELEPYIPTLKEVQDAKKQEIYMAYQAAKVVGVEVSISTGTERFPLTDEDITFLIGKQFELSSSANDYISYQDSNNHCKFYSREDMQTIIQQALLFVNYQTAYRNNLCEWVEQCTTAEEVEVIYYGADIPEEYQNEVYKLYLTQMGETE